MGNQKNIKKILENFKKEVNKEVPVKEMILFGSRTKGKKGRDTDIDLLIVSQEFKKMDFFQRGAKMYDYWKLRYPVDFLCYTPEEFKKLSKKVTIVSEAIREGQKI